jgi:DNA-binding MarR family transcriptional regulator
LASALHPDLDGAAYGLLALLQDAGPLRASDLVVRLGLDKSTVSRQVSTLVDLGLVDRAADPADGRAQVLTPSAEGSARLSGIRDARRARWEADMADWPAEDVATLAELLGRLNRLGDAREAEPTDD